VQTNASVAAIQGCGAEARSQSF